MVNPAFDGIELNTVTKVVSGLSNNNAMPKTDRNAKGLSVWHTVLFIVGEVAGIGVLALPNAMLGAGWIGFVLLLYFCIIAGYSAIILGRCWVILEERHAKYGVERIGNPYQMIAHEAYGPRMTTLANVTIIVTQFGAGTVYTLLMSGMLKELLMPLWNVSICYWTMIVIAVLIPMSWFGAPKDFWGLAAGATVTVIVAAIMLLVQSYMDIGIHTTVRYPDPEIKGFSLAFGGILFSFGGSGAFPTIQNDMKNRAKFSMAAIVGFSVIFAIYAPIAVSGYVIFGNHVQPNLAMTVSAGPLRVGAQLLLMGHLLCAVMIVINPIFQELEGKMKFSKDSISTRCLFRTIVMLCMLFVAVSVPSFGKIMDLIGGSTNTLLVFVFPTLFYMKLASLKDPAWKEWTIPLHERVFMWEIIFVGFIGSVASTISAIWEIATPDALSLPCYVS